MATPPYNPFPIAGKVYESDLSTLITGGHVKVTNNTKNTVTASNINSAGEYMVDLANLRTGYDIGDKIIVEAYSTDGSKYGIYKKLIASGETFWDLDLDIDYISDFNTILREHGKDYTIQQVTVTIDSNGHSTKATTNYIITSVINVMDGSADEVKAGLLKLGDIIAFVSPNDINKKYLILSNYISFDNSTYKILNVIKELGIGSEQYTHLEVHASRIN